jgi:hypothetical protein
VENQQAGALFDQWLERHTSDVVESIVQAYDFARVSAVADVGGGLGSLLAAVLKAYPTLRGALADHPAVVNSARDSLAALGLLDRCEIHAVDFFEAVPAGFDLYLLKSVLHDWDDDKSVAILRTIRRALSGPSRLLLIERVLPDSPLDDPETVWIDLHMMCVTGGRERTLPEFQRLFAAADLKLQQVISTQGPFRLLESSRA